MITRVKLSREARGLKAYEIARAVGITRTQFSLIEGGHVLPAPWLAVRIADIFGLAVGDLFPEVIAYEQEQSRADEGGSSEGTPDASTLRARGRRRSAADGRKEA